MMKTFVAVPAVLFCLCTLSACVNSVPSQFYLLSPQGDSLPSEIVSDEKAPLVGLGPIELPGYLERDQILTRRGKHELRLSEVHYWAEPLDENFAMVLTRNLSRLKKSRQFVLFPWFLDLEVDLRVVVRVIRFDGVLGKKAELVVVWLMYQPGKVDTKNLRFSEIRVPTSGDGYEEMVAAMSEAIFKLSQEISAEIERLHGG